MPAKASNMVTPTKKTQSKAPKQASGSKVLHPKYNEMLIESISKQTVGRQGVSVGKIVKYIISNFSVGDNEKQIKNRIKLALRKCLEDEVLVQVTGNGFSGSYKMSSKQREILKKEMKAAEKKTGKKQTAVKTPTKKKSTASPAPKKAPAKKSPAPKKSSKPVVTKKSPVPKKSKEVEKSPKKSEEAQKSPASKKAPAKKETSKPVASKAKKAK